jgi:hypothetical protein
MTTPAPIILAAPTLPLRRYNVTNNARHSAIHVEGGQTSVTNPVSSSYTQRDRFDVSAKDSLLIRTKSISPAGGVGIDLRLLSMTMANDMIYAVAVTINTGTINTLAAQDPTLADRTRLITH